MTVKKIMLTQEQADVVELYLEIAKGDKSQCIDEHSEVYHNPMEWFIDALESLNELPPSDLSRALLVGYNIKITIKTGDYEENKSDYFTEDRKDIKS